MKKLFTTLFLSLFAMAASAEELTYNNNMNKVNLDQVVYVKKADNQDAAIFYKTNGAATAAIPGVYAQVMSNNKFVCDGSYYINATNSAKCINKNLVIDANRSAGFQGNSQVNYTMVGGYSLTLDMGSEAFLGSYWSNL